MTQQKPSATALEDLGYLETFITQLKEAIDKKMEWFAVEARAQTAASDFSLELIANIRAALQSAQGVPEGVNAVINGFDCHQGKFREVTLRVPNDYPARIGENVFLIKEADLAAAPKVETPEGDDLPICLLTDKEVSATAIARWRAQYKDWKDEGKFYDGTTKREISDALDNCQSTPDEIEKVLDESWAKPFCSCCHEYVKNVAIISTEPDCHICKLCCKKLVLIIGE